MRQRAPPFCCAFVVRHGRVVDIIGYLQIVALGNLHGMTHPGGYSVLGALVGKVGFARTTQRLEQVEPFNQARVPEDLFEVAM